jgi:diguanylate cyclase (GGDEF)-like protein
VLAEQEEVFNPFMPRPAFRRRRTWCRTAGGGVACLDFSAAPIMEAGTFEGMRGAVHDVTAEDEHESRASAALRRGEVMEHILRQMRQEVLAPRMMAAVLEELSAALGAAGVVVLNLIAEPGPSGLLHGTGADASHLLPLLHEAMQDETADPLLLVLDGHPAIVCPSYTRFGERTGLAVWRAAGEPVWPADDAHLVSSATTLVRVVLEHEAIQRELALQARTDPLTGLLNRRSFLEEASRRIDRLDRERLPGTLMFVDLDNFKRLNDCCGHDVGDEALVQMAKLLRATVRPADLVARLGGDEFALWMDGSDELTAAERAERLRLDGPAILAARLPPLAPELTTSIGIAARHPHIAESLEEVMRRADIAMYEVKRAGRAQWRVSPNPSYI